MIKIQWDDSYSVGVAKLDQQHKRIVELINLLLTEPEGGFAPDAMESILNQLTEYVHAHFETEEKLLAEFDYPELSLQREEHKKFRKDLAAICMNAIQDPKSIPIHVQRFLSEWWLDHILVRDMQYRPFLTSRGVK